MAQFQDPPREDSPGQRNSRPLSYQPQSSSNSNAQDASRPRASSSLSPERSGNNLRNPAISEAINSAFTQSNASAPVDPDLVAQITEQVLNTLRASGAAPPATSPTLQEFAQTQQRVQTQHPSSSAAVDRSAPPRSGSDAAPAFGEAASSAAASHVASASHFNNESYYAADTQSFSNTTPQTFDGNFEGNSGSIKSPTPSDTTDSKRSVDPQRPSPPPRDPTGDLTTLEKIWKPLFDSEGGPTERLGQFLRGLAMHIIEDFDPPKSIVIPPQKMLKFYDTAKLPEEIYPWHTLFGGTMTNSSLSHVYRDLKCEHHFVQNSQREKPSVPALTPVGFEIWMTHLIRAHPELEFQRFAKAVLHMPISNADNVKERFPKELSRRLFPKQPNMDILLDIEDAILADPVVELTPYGIEQQKAWAAAQTSQGATGSSQHASQAAAQRGTTTVRSPPAGSADQAPRPPPVSNPIPIPKPSEHPAATYNSQAALDNNTQSFPSNRSDAASDDMPSRSIERQRKPYHAQAGGGKVYDKPEGIAAPPLESAQHHPRANSMASRSRPPLDPGDEHFVQPRYRGGSVATGRPAASRPLSPPVNPQYIPHHRTDLDLPTMPYGNNNGRIAAQELHDNNLRQTASWSEYSWRSDLPPPPPGPPPPREYPLPPPPPRSHDEDTFRRQSNYLSSPPRH